MCIPCTCTACSNVSIHFRKKSDIENTSWALTSSLATLRLDFGDFASKLHYPLLTHATENTLTEFELSDCHSSATGPNGWTNGTQTQCNA